jgi:flavin reductase (DIM6/NTAB) family NADH-FMN oxidoreductase RutF
MQNNNLAVSMKLGMRRLASGVCVLSTKLANQQRFAMTVSSVTSVSDSPASLLVCINQQVSQQGHLATRDSKFAVNVLSTDHRDVSDICAGREPARDRFDTGNWQDDETGLPILGDALAVFICQTDQVMTYGTHKIIVGAIHKVILNGADVDPLLYADGCYGAFSRQQ